MTQGLNRSFIFDEPQNIKFYIKLMYEAIKTYEVKIVAYCIMNNHAHMLLEVKNINNLSKYMQSINTRYGKYYNKKYKRVGYVFRDRYRAEGIYSEEQLYNCIKYIYDNPVKAGICEDAKEYKYSNYKEINITVNNNYTFIDVEEDKEELCIKLVSEYIKENNISIKELNTDKRKLRQLLIKLKKDNEISFRIISKTIKINRETLRQEYNK